MNKNWSHTLSHLGILSRFCSNARETVIMRSRYNNSRIQCHQQTESYKFRLFNVVTDAIIMLPPFFILSIFIMPKHVAKRGIIMFPFTDYILGRPAGKRLKYWRSSEEIVKRALKCILIWCTFMLLPNDYMCDLWLLIYCQKIIAKKFLNNNCMF